MESASETAPDGNSNVESTSETAPDGNSNVESASETAPDGVSDAESPRGVSALDADARVAVVVLAVSGFAGCVGIAAPEGVRAMLDAVAHRGDRS